MAYLQPVEHRVIPPSQWLCTNATNDLSKDPFKNWRENFESPGDVMKNYGKLSPVVSAAHGRLYKVAKGVLYVYIFPEFFR